MIAEETGGRAVVNRNDITDALKQIDAETSDYYVLGYYSTNVDPQKRRRSIEVKVGAARTAGRVPDRVLAQAARSRIDRSSAGRGCDGPVHWIR